MVDSIEFSEGYSSVNDIAEAVIENTAKAQGVETDSLEQIPITAIDEAEMPKAIENDSEINQELWDKIRTQIRATIEEKGYVVV